jgi:putative DNA primase/helicase
MNNKIYPKSQPKWLEPIWDNIPDELKKHPHWVVWKAVWNEEEQKFKKPPIIPVTGDYAKPNDISTSASFEIAKSAYLNGNYDGVGIIISKRDKLCGVDLDKCFDPTTEEFQSGAEDALRLINSYSELSPGGEGLRIFTFAVKPGPLCRKNCYELYDDVRFLTITGHILTGGPITVNDRQNEINEFYKNIFGPPKNSTPKSNLPGAANAEAGRLSIPDIEKIIRLAENAKNGEKFKRLWNGDSSGYDSHSEADLALCQFLFFYSNGNSDLVDQFFRFSGLCRNKWDEKRSADGSTYGEMTIRKAVESSIQYTHSDTQTLALTVPTPNIPIKTPNYNSRVFTLEEIMNTDFPEIKWIVPNIIPEGLSLFVGKSKTGKSYISLQIAIAVASSGLVFSNTNVEPGRVLYLALEDGQRRIKDRAIKLLGNNPPPNNLDLCFKWSRLDDKGLDELKKYIEKNPDIRVIIIDTLAKVWPVSTKKNNSAYHNEYKTMEGLKEIADDKNIALIMVHHQRKSIGDDMLDVVLGTTAIAGTADTILIFERKRFSNNARLSVTGRDVSENIYNLDYDSATGVYSLSGDKSDLDEYQLTSERKQVLDVLENAGKALKTGEIATILNKKNTNISNQLKALKNDGLVKCLKYGTYEIVKVVSDNSQESCNLASGSGDEDEGGCSDHSGVWGPAESMGTESGESNECAETSESGECSLTGPVVCLVNTGVGVCNECSESTESTESTLPLQDNPNIYIQNECTESTESDESNETTESSLSNHTTCVYSPTLPTSESSTECLSSCNNTLNSQHSALSVLSLETAQNSKSGKVRCLDCFFFESKPIASNDNYGKCNSETKFIGKASFPFIRQINNSTEEIDCNHFHTKEDKNFVPPKPEPKVIDFVARKAQQTESRMVSIDDTIESPNISINCNCCAYLSKSIPFRYRDDYSEDCLWCERKENVIKNPSEIDAEECRYYYYKK